MKLVLAISFYLNPLLSQLPNLVLVSLSISVILTHFLYFYCCGTWHNKLSGDGKFYSHLLLIITIIEKGKKNNGRSTFRKDFEVYWKIATRRVFIELLGSL